MPQFTTRTLFVVVAVLSAFFAGWLFGSTQRTLNEVHELSRLTDENVLLKSQVARLESQLAAQKLANQ